MVSVEEIIGNLLLRHNCVIIPGFGGFVAKQTSARIDYKNGIITPPGKSLLFNRQLMTNDGLLISEFAHQNEITYDNAVSAINQLISGWNAELSRGNRVSIDRVGFLFFDQERNICFEQDRYFNLLLSSYGLSSVHFLTETDVAIAQQKIEAMEQTSVSITPEAFNGVQQEEKQTVEQPVTLVSAENKRPETVIPPVTRKKSNFWKYAAAACAIPILFYSFWIPMKTDVLESRIISFQDFNPFHQRETAVYKQHPVQDMLSSKSEKSQSLDEQLQTIESNESIYSYNLTDETYVLIKIDKHDEAAHAEPAKAEMTPIAANTSHSTGSINYIVGCFSDEKNAENLVNELKTKGFNAFIKDRKGGLSRVSIGSADSRETMNQLMARADAAGYSGWILK